METLKSQYEQIKKQLLAIEDENQHLREQVKRLVKTENELYLIQEQLDSQIRLYRQLSEAGKQFNASLELAEILQITLQFVLYELNFERCLILIRPGDDPIFHVEAMDGYYDETEVQKISSLRLSLTEAVLLPLLSKASPVIYPQDSDQEALLALRQNLGMDEYVILPMGGESEQVLRLLVAGNTAEMARHQTRIEPDSEALVGLISLASQASTAINNVNFYQALRDNEKKYRTLFEDSRDAIFITTPAGRFVDVNQAMLELSGYTREEFMALNVQDTYTDPADRTRFRQAIEKLGSVRDFEVKYRRKDGTEMDCLLTATIRRGNDGKILSYQGIVRDITGQKRAQKLLQEYSNTLEQEVVARTTELIRANKEAQEARAEAEQANAAKSAFLATMSHELRTPLNAIIGFTRIVRRKADGTLPDRQLDNLDKVLVSAEHLLGLINTILDIAKIEAGRMDVTPREFSVEKLVEMCAITAQPLLKADVELVKEMDPGLPTAYSDQDKLKQILLNLLSNAAKFTHQGNITLRVRLDERQAMAGDSENGASPVLRPPSFVVFEVADSGIGISQEALSRIFEEFQQADNTTTRKYGGTGLGLSISRKLAQLLGGDLAATSIENEGSTFTLTVPLRYQGEMPSS